MAEFTSIILSQQVSAQKIKQKSWILKPHRTWQEVPSNPLPQSASCQPQSLPGHSVAKGPGKASTELVETPSPPRSLRLEDSEDILPISFPQVDTSPVSSCALSLSLSLPSVSKGKKTCASRCGPSPLDTLKVTFYVSRVTRSSYPPTSRPGNGQYSSGHLKGFTHGRMISPSRYFIGHSLSQNITL